jgi:small subunit ribosomal protein S15
MLHGRCARQLRQAAAAAAPRRAPLARCLAVLPHAQQQQQQQQRRRPSGSRLALQRGVALDLAAASPRRGLSLLADESLPAAVGDGEGTVAAASPSPSRAAEAASLENTYIMGIEPQLLDGQPEMVRRMFMLLNGRRKDLTKAQKRAALERHRRFVDDTGSPEVQAAVLSRGIHAMSAHLSANKKDNNCKRILTRLIHRRRKVLQHLYRLSPKRYYQVRHAYLPPARSEQRHRERGPGAPECSAAGFLR